MRQDPIQRLRHYYEGLADKLGFEVAGQTGRVWLRLMFTLGIALLVGGGLVRLALNEEPVEVSYPALDANDVAPASAGHSLKRK